MTPSSESVWTIARVGDERDRQVRPDDEAGEQVAEHDRLAQPLEQHRRDGGDAEDDGERLEKLVGLQHARELRAAARARQSLDRRNGGG